MNNLQINQWARQIAAYIDNNGIEGEPDYTFTHEYGDFEAEVHYLSDTESDGHPDNLGWWVTKQEIRVISVEYFGEGELSKLELAYIAKHLNKMLN